MLKTELDLSDSLQSYDLLRQERFSRVPLNLARKWERTPDHKSLA